MTRTAASLVIVAGAASLLAGAVPRATLADRTVTAAGASIHLRCGGLRKPGAPLVVFEAGAGNSADTWRDVHAPVAAFARACAHDRPGLGASGPPPPNLSPDSYVALVRTVLDAAREPPPYVLVGHSMGGLIVSLYAVTFPEEVTGLVLVDSSHEGQLERFAALPPTAPQPAAAARTPPPEAVPFSQFVAAVGRQPWRGTLPLVVLSRGRWSGAAPDASSDARGAIWAELQRDLASRSPNARHIVAARSGHYVQNDEPTLVIDAIRTVLAAR